MNENVKLPNTSWNEARIYDGVDHDKYSSNFRQIQKNERRVKEYCEAHGLKREDHDFNWLLIEAEKDER